MQDINRTYAKIPKVYLNLIYTFTIGLVLYFLVLVLSFLISRFLPGDPVLAYLPTPFTPAEYDQMYHQLGFDRPLYEQFIMYLFRMFTGNWGISLSIAHGADVSFMIKTNLPRTIDLLLLPLLVGTTLGLLFGNLGVKLKNKWLDRSFQTLALIGCAIPVFLLGMLFQYFLGYLIPLFPTTGYKTFSYGDPSFVTGFRIIDSLLSGELYYIPDYLYHFVQPWSILTIGIGSLVTLLTRIYLKNKSRRRSIVPNSFNIAISFGIIFANLIFIETIFNLHGFTELAIEGLMYADYWVINAVMFLIPITFIILIVFVNLLYIVFGVIRPHIGKKKFGNPNNESKEEGSTENNEKSINQEHKRQNNTTKSSFRTFSHYFYKKLISPSTIIGSVFVIFFLLISIFPQILTPYTFEDAIGIYADPWNAPSPLHPLGTTQFGRDVYARIVYGIQSSLLTSLIPIGIGLLGGLLIGIPMSLLNRRFKMSVEISMIIFFIYPMIFGLLIVSSIVGMIIPIPMTGLGLLLIPFFTLIIAKTRLNGFDIMKKVIPYVPLFFGFVVLIQLGLGFLGFSNPNMISIGYDMNVARTFLYVAPWASFFPGLFTILLVL
ncbi:MAG: hypothetical protein ACFFFB_23575, partial [Candidatus Heimdallarchaeota archaeon]